MVGLPAQPRRPGRVLIVKPSALGDVVTALPVLRGLRRTFPDCHVSWLLSEACAPLVAHDSQLDEVVIFERRKLGTAWRSPSAAWALLKFLVALRRGRYDWVIDLQGLFRSGFFCAASGAPIRAGSSKAREGARTFYNLHLSTQATHTVERNIEMARQLGIDSRPADMKLEISVAGRNFADAFCQGLNVQRARFLVCVPSTRWPSKLYPVRHWRAVVGRLSRRVPIAVAGGPGDVQLCGQIADAGGNGVVNLAGQTAVDELAGLIAASGGVICSDSAAKFIAAATGVDCLTLMGPTRVESTGPFLRGRAIVADVPCQGCLKRRCPHITCMQTIDPADVIDSAEKMLNGQLT